MMKLIDACKVRFPNPDFVISCFKTIDEIQTKILTDVDTIIYEDEYTIHKYNLKSHKQLPDIVYNDYYIINKKEGQKHIYVCDVIDHLIEHKIITDAGDHKFLERIVRIHKSKQTNSIPVYAGSFGS